jgi:hypothetical protein
LEFAEKIAYFVRASPLLNFLHDIHCYKLAQWCDHYQVSGRFASVVAGAYGCMGMINYLRISNRQKKGREWHSMSRGERVFGSENNLRDIGIALFVFFIFALIAPAVAMLFLYSRMSSHYLIANAQKSFYNRYLDIIDAKIEGEFMQQCLEKGEPPRDVNGLVFTIPGPIKGEHRTRVARVVAGAQFAPAAPAATPAASRPQTQFSASPKDNTDLKAEMLSQLAASKPVFDEAAKVIGNVVAVVFGIVRSRRFLFFVLTALLLWGIYAVGIRVAHRAKTVESFVQNGEK